MGKKGRSKSKAISSEKPQSSVAAEVAPRKVGILCHSMVIDEGGDYEVKLYVVNVNLETQRNAFPTATPAVRFTFPNRGCIHAVCVVNSTVYMFGGYCPWPKPPPESQEKYARKFLLPEEVLSCDGRNVQVKEEELERIPVMNHPKALPMAILTPNGQQFLVFGFHIALTDSYKAFELYNLEGCNWETLPGIPYSCFDCKAESCLCSCEINSYSFIDEVHFFLETKFGSFVLNIREKSWTTVGVKFVLDDGQINGYNFVTVKGQFALTKYGTTYYLEDGGVLADPNYERNFQPGIGPQFPLSKFPPPNTPGYLQQFNVPCIVSLGEEDEGRVCKTCILQIETSCRTQGYKARLLLDVCSTKFFPEPYITKTTVSNRVSLRIDFLATLYGIILISL